MQLRHFFYSQSSGLVTDEHGETLAHGWAGRGEGKNNPAMQQVKNTGPLPCGTYRIMGWFKHPRLGPLVARLIQIEGESFGRDEFFIHGPDKNPADYGQESKGCIVVLRKEREEIADMTQGVGHLITVAP